MRLAIDLLRSPHVGLRELREGLSANLRKNRTMIVTDRGVPKNVILPYADVIEILEMIDELTDATTLKNIREGRAAVRAGAPGVPFSRLAREIRSGNK
jgi:hypothetical protein